MKAFNIIALSLALALLGSYALCYIGEQALGNDAKLVVFPVVLALGLFSRRIVQRILGYTLEEAMKDKKDGQ